VTEAAKIIISLTNDYKVPYLHIIDVVLKKHGASSFDEVPADKHAEVKADAEAWLLKMESLDEAIETITNINDSTHDEHKLSAAAFTVIGKAGVKSAGEIPYDKLDSVLDEMSEFAKAWDAWFKSQQA
jgi:hypothetical protein